MRPIFFVFSLLLLWSSPLFAAAPCARHPDECVREVRHGHRSTRPTCTSVQQGGNWVVDDCADTSCLAGSGPWPCFTHCDGATWSVWLCGPTTTSSTTSTSSTSSTSTSSTSSSSTSVTSTTSSSTTTTT